jgi:ribosomal protein L6P/L9E
MSFRISILRISSTAACLTPHRASVYLLSHPHQDEITIQGSSLDAVSQSCANIQQIAKVNDKDIRKFLDGVYVSMRGHIVEDA